MRICSDYFCTIQRRFSVGGWVYCACWSDRTGHWTVIETVISEKRLQRRRRQQISITIPLQSGITWKVGQLRRPLSPHVFQIAVQMRVPNRRLSIVQQTCHLKIRNASFWPLSGCLSHRWPRFHAGPCKQKLSPNRTEKTIVEQHQNDKESFAFHRHSCLPLPFLSLTSVIELSS